MRKESEISWNHYKALKLPLSYKTQTFKQSVQVMSTVNV